MTWLFLNNSCSILQTHPWADVDSPRHCLSVPLPNRGRSGVDALLRDSLCHRRQYQSHSQFGLLYGRLSGKLIIYLFTTVSNSLQEVVFLPELSTCVSPFTFLSIIACSPDHIHGSCMMTEPKLLEKVLAFRRMTRWTVNCRRSCRKCPSV